MLPPLYELILAVSTLCVIVGAVITGAHILWLDNLVIIVLIISTIFYLFK